ncbi:glyoxalase superfamily protein [Deinococcus soli (ex Cha et al. 2016)]|uniref:Glyoxalase-related protein domain-containing protein n=2 Tax=Deinococcus soli (ex Cha et al. 2016) TaxID=1309411 RepID=A0AAE4BLE1_9DEIO|nr:glyoxalase superfamily protein [Deinococcus soli (ex Cha et al. 2016)]MDR6218868.1 hypothetical protein [Deinococcus soli (ex Cha et al. 2016)]MDR6328665.1 hypothetical protein [Deinococcus soli (ex Cha et al. 2016)]MDR6751848.1 hypothetical protein [Deinococcus soli (ex Cha et al. 2016)]
MTDIKAQARRLHHLLRAQHGLNLSYSQTLHLLAQSHGLSNWQALKAQLAAVSVPPAPDVTVLDRPYTTEQLRALRAEHDGYVSGVIALDIDSIAGTDYERFLDLISSELTGTDLLMDVSYTVVGTRGETILLEVRGDPDTILGPDDEDDTEDDTEQDEDDTDPFTEDTP